MCHCHSLAPYRQPWREPSADLAEFVRQRLRQFWWPFGKLDVRYDVFDISPLPQPDNMNVNVVKPEVNDIDVT